MQMQMQIQILQIHIQIQALTLAWLGCYKNMRELRNSNGFNLDWLALIDLYLIPIWLIYEIDQSGSSWSELDQ